MVTKTPAEIRRIGIDALVQKMGPLGMIQFLQQFDLGSGDYTHERKDWLNDLGFEEIVEEINKGKEPTPN